MSVTATGSSFKGTEREKNAGCGEKNMSDIIFKNWTLAGKTVKNRMSNLPMEGNDAEADGSPSEMTIERYRRLAAGGWGIIYVEAIAPAENGKARAGQLVITKENIDSFRRLTDSIRAASPEPPLIIFQVNHAGRYGLSPLVAYRNEILDPTWKIPAERPATEGELSEAAEACAGAVKLSKTAGADGADLKCCHGYLAIELARPANRRDDDFGGAFENRTRFLKRMLGAAAEVADKDFFYGTRISVMEGIPGGVGDAPGATGTFSPEADAAALVDLLVESGSSFICETAGIPYYNPELVRPPAKHEKRDEVLSMHHDFSAWLKSRAAKCAVIGAGFTLLENDFLGKAGEMIERNQLDAAGFGRQSFADPETPLKIMNGDGKSVKWCKGCKKNNCSFLLRSGVHTGCVIYDDYYKEAARAARKDDRE